MQFRVVALLSAMLLLASSALADSSSVRLSGDYPALQAVTSQQFAIPSASRANGYAPMNPMSFSAEVEGKSFVFHLTKVRAKNWNAYITGDSGRVIDPLDVVFFKGTVEEVKGNSYPLAASVFNDNGVQKIHFYFGRSEVGAEDKLFKITVAADGSQAASVDSAFPSAMGRRLCEADDLPKVAQSGSPFVSSFPEGHQIQGVTLKVAQISTEADFQYFQQFGSSANAEIASLVNAVEAIYERDLGVTFDIDTQHVFSTSSQPYTSTDSSDLLSEFIEYTNTQNHLGSADVFHLFSGKDFDSNVAGLAYVGVVCASPSYAFGISTHISSAIDLVVVAHELGHNFGANHDSSLPRSVMYPSADSTQTSFSATSQSEIGSHISDYGSCLSTRDSEEPEPEPRTGNGSMSLRASFKNSKFTASLNVTGATDEACTLKLRLSSSRTMSGAKTYVVGPGNLTMKLKARTSRRTKRSNPKVYVQGVFDTCPTNAEAIYSRIVSVTTKGSSTRKSDVKPSSWIKDVIKKLAPAL